MQTWRIIYPGGDRSKLDMALVFWYEESDWDLASQRQFSYEEEESCREYMVELAQRNNLSYPSGKHDGKDYSAYLD